MKVSKMTLRTKKTLIINDTETLLVIVLSVVVLGVTVYIAMLRVGRLYVVILSVVAPYKNYFF